MISVTITTRARKELRKLPQEIAVRIVKKIEWYGNQADPLHFATSLEDQEKLYRFRIGTYRVIFELQEDVINVLKIAHRRESYK